MEPIDLVNKIKWEGGILEAINSGLKADDLDDSNPNLKSAWVNLCKAYKDFQELVSDLETQLSDLEDFDYEE